MRSRSGSSSSQASAKGLSADNLAIQVAIGSGKTIKLNVRPVHTVSHILEFLSASTSLPTDAKLMLDDKPLEPSSTVAELQLSETSTLQLSPPIRSPSPTESSEAAPTAEVKSQPTSAATSGTSTPTRPRKSNKPRCSKDGCKGAAQPIVGDCGFCQKRFCGKHRMLESHNCEGLEDARQADKQRNAAKLEGERTVMLRGL